MKKSRLAVRPLLRILTTLAIIAFSATAFSCPDYLKSYKTKYLGKLDICQTHDRYQAAIAKLRETTARPDRIGNVMAPRFISLQTWNSKKSDDPRSALTIYEPAPLTWINWEAGAEMIAKAASLNLDSRKVQPLTFEFLHAVHAVAMKTKSEITGHYRQGGEIGNSLSKKDALTPNQVAGLRSIEFKGVLSPLKNIVEFHATECFEDRTQEFRSSFNASSKLQGFNGADWPEIDQNLFFTDGNGSKKQCGYIRYAHPAEILPQLNLWLDYINGITETWGTTEPQGDPLLVAARAQRWFIAIHPYVDGNGRASRFVMDLLLQSLGLPAPIIKDMNADMYMSEKSWAMHVGTGVLRAVVAVETCASKPESLGCKEIATSIETVPQTSGVLP